MAGIYTNNGQIATTTVNGLTKVNLFAADGSVNVVLDDAVNKGLYHPSGAIRVNSGTGTTTYDSTGAYYSNHLYGLSQADSVSLINNPSFALVGDSLTMFNNQTLSLTGVTLSRDAAGLITVPKAGHGLNGTDDIYLVNFDNITYERYGARIPVDANNFQLQTSVLGAAGTSAALTNCFAVLENRFVQVGYWLWLQSRVQGGFRFLGNFGQGGDLSSDVPNAITQALARSPDVIILDIGINDILSGATTTTVINNITAAIDQITAAGKRALVLAIAPVETGNINYTVQRNTNIITVNTAISSYCSSSISNRKFIDIHTPLYDAPNQAILPNYTSDTIHWTSRAGKLIADTIYSSMSSWFTWDTTMLPTASNSATVINGATKIRNVGPWTSSSTATVGTGMTGVVPSSAGDVWHATRTAGTGTGVCSVQSDVDGQGFWFQCVYTPGGADSLFMTAQNSGWSLATLGLTVSDTIMMGMELDISGAQAGNLQGFSLVASTNANNNTQVGTANQENVSARVNDSYRVQLFTGPTKLQATSTTVFPSFNFNFTAAGSAVTIKIRKICVYKL